MIGAAHRAGRAGRGLLPAGQLLTPQIWAPAPGIVWLLWLHVAGIFAFALVRGVDLGHALLEIAPLAVFALVAAHPALGRRARSAAAVLALGYVGLHRTLLGALAPTAVFNHPAAQQAPWKWALIHGGFVLAASVACLVNWRLSERQAVEISRLVSRLEGLARTDPVTGCPTEVRSTDLLARYGGEEFVLLLPACALDDAVRIVERLWVVTPG